MPDDNHGAPPRFTWANNPDAAPDAAGHPPDAPDKTPDSAGRASALTGEVLLYPDDPSDQSERTPMGPQPSPDDIDPTGAADKVEFGELLRQLKENKHVSLKQIEDDTHGTALQLSRSSIGGWHVGESLPDEANLRRYLLYFGVSDSRIADWQRIRNQVSKSERQQRRRTDVIAAKDAELSRAHAEIETLKTRENVLTDQVAEAIAQRQELQDRLKTVEVTAAATEAQLRAQIADYLMHLEQANQRIGALQYELGHVRGLRERAEVERNHLLDQREELAQDAPDSDDQAMLQFMRAEDEQKLREKAEAENARLLGEIEALKKQITEGASKPGAELAQPERPLPVPSVNRAPATNTDVEVAVHVQRDEFDQEYGVIVPFAWYCLQCDCGGELQLTSCPHCKHAVERNFQKETFVRLPSRPRARLIHLDGEGNYDYPGIPRGRVCVQIIVTRG